LPVNDDWREGAANAGVIIKLISKKLRKILPRDFNIYLEYTFVKKSTIPKMGVHIYFFSQYVMLNIALQ
jgi:hypothetical protein